MPAPKDATTFDGHLGQLISNLARPHGGRKMIADLIGVSTKTIDRRALGDGGYTVRDLHLIAAELHVSAQELIDMALRAYGKGDAAEGLRKLIEVEGVHLVSEPPTNLTDHRRKKTPAEMTFEELESERSAANTDPEIGFDEPEAP